MTPSAPPNTPAEDAPRGRDTPLVFDRALVRRRRQRAARQADGEAYFLRDHVVDDLLDRLFAVNRVFDTGVEWGGGGALARRWREDAHAQAKVRWLASADLTAEHLRGLPAGLAADEERAPLADASVMLIAAPLSLHLVNDLPGALVQIRRALRPDGLFIGALFGGATLRELRESLLAAEAEHGGAGLRVAPFADALDMAGLLQRAGFALPVSDRDRLTVRYGDPLSLLKDLRAMGETAAMTGRTRRPLTRGLLLRMAEIYQERFADPDGKVRATFDIVWATGWAPHASQQKPLRPGAAQTRLADALGVREHSAGEKAGR